MVNISITIFCIFVCESVVFHVFILICWQSVEAARNYIPNLSLFAYKCTSAGFLFSFFQIPLLQ